MTTKIPTTGHDLRVPETASGLLYAVREHECESTSHYLSSDLAEQLIETFVANKVEEATSKLRKALRKCRPHPTVTRHSR